MAPSRTRRISVVIPALNEEAALGRTLRRLQQLRADGHEVIVVDGGSDDGTVRVAGRVVDHVLVSTRGRARQMNVGASVAVGDVLWFVHADTLAPAGAADAILGGLGRSGRRWGRFDVRLSGHQRALRVVETLMNLRSRLSGIATGDQAIFVERELFRTIGGFADVPLMEDVALCRALAPSGRPLNLREAVVTSSRRWECSGIVATIVLMWGLRLGYALGVSPARLARFYHAG